MNTSSGTMSSEQAPPRERFQPGRLEWGAAGICGFIALTFIVTTGGLWKSLPSKGDPDAFGLFVLILGAIFTGLFIFASVSRTVQLINSDIHTGKDTLSWRTWQGTQSVRWENILDYYETHEMFLYRVHRKSNLAQEKTPSQSFVCVVNTPAGECRFSQSWPNAHRLQQIIGERAVNARAKAWDLLGTRPELDWPKTFDYGNGWSRWGVAVIRIICSILAIVAFVKLYGACLLVITFLGWGLGMTMFFCGIACLLGTVGMVLFLNPSFGELRQRRSQSITLTKTGIFYKDSGRIVEARWSEVTRLFTDGRIYSIETQNGRFNFRGTISQAAILESAIAKRTHDALPTGWDLTVTERLDRPAAAQSLENPRFYSFRTRTNRVHLLVCWLEAGIFVVLIVKDLLTTTPPGNLMSRIAFDAAHGVPLAGLLLSMAWIGRWFFATGVWTDAESITQLTVFGRKSMRWTDVQEVKASGKTTPTGISLSDGRQRIWISPYVADSKDLLAEIKQHSGTEKGI